MEPVMLVEVLDDHRRVQLRQRVGGAGAQCRIGRSVTCDIPLDDAFAAPEHVLLTLQPEGGVLVQDLGTRNGTTIDGQRIATAKGRLISGGEIRIGHTRVRVRTAGESLAPERPLHRDPLQQHRTVAAVAGLVLCLLFAAFMAWTRAPDQLAQGVVVAVLLAIALLAIWTGAWALVSRLTVGAWMVRIHLALAGLCVALWGWGFWLYTLAAFALQWRWLGPAVAALAAVVACLAAWRHLRYATHFHRPAAMALALLAPLLGGGLWWLIDLQVDPRTVNRIEQGARILPPSVRIVASEDLGDFLSDAGELKRDANRARQRSLLAAPILDEED
jgi:hypothetical protein